MKAVFLALALLMPTAALAQQPVPLVPITLSSDQVGAMLKQLGSLPAAQSYDMITMLLTAEHAAQEAAKKPPAAPKKP